MLDHVMDTMESGTARPRGSEVVLQMRNLSKKYGQRLAVDNLNLTIQRGDIFGFLGPNGAGKTTTIRMAFGLITPTAGSVEVLGKDVALHRADVLPLSMARIRCSLRWSTQPSSLLWRSY